MADRRAADDLNGTEMFSHSNPLHARAPMSSALPPPSDPVIPATTDGYSIGLRLSFGSMFQSRSTSSASNAPLPSPTLRPSTAPSFPPSALSLEGSSLGKNLASALISHQQNIHPKPRKKKQLGLQRLAHLASRDLESSAASDSPAPPPHRPLLRPHHLKDKQALTLVHEIEYLGSLDRFVFVHFWLPDFLLSIAQGAMSYPCPVSSPLSALDDEESGLPIALSIGASLPYFLAVRSNPTAAIEEWTNSYPAMKELLLDAPWFSLFVESFVVELDKYKNGHLMEGFKLFRRQDFGDSAVRHAADPERLSERSNAALAAEVSNQKRIAALMSNLDRKGGRRRIVIIIAMAYAVVAMLLCIPQQPVFQAKGPKDVWTLLVLNPIFAWVEAFLLFSLLSIMTNLPSSCSKQSSYLEAAMFKIKIFHSKSFWFALTFLYATYQTMTFCIIKNTFVAPVPWFQMLLVGSSPLIAGAILSDMRRNHPGMMPAPAEISSALKLSVICILPIAAALPLATGLYRETEGYKQLLWVIGFGMLRYACCSLGDYFGPKWGVPDIVVITIITSCDLMYETHAITLFSSAKMNVTLAAAPVMDFLGNIITLWYIIVKLEGKKREQCTQLVALAVRELLEITTSLGVMSIFGCIWKFGSRFNFFLIDATNVNQLTNAFTMSAVDFACEIVVFVIFNKVVYKVWRVSLVDLMKAFCFAIGEFEFFGLVAGITMFMMTFLSYHWGNDPFFRFLWLEKKNIGDSSWCSHLQRDLCSSCYTSEDFDVMTSQCLPMESIP